MTKSSRATPRKAIEEYCRFCIYDHLAKGTWRQQVTLCAVSDCPLFPNRPVTTAPIPDGVLDYYQVTGAERAILARSTALKRQLNAHNSVREGRAKGAHK